MLSNMSVAQREKLLARFMAKVARSENGCWLWTGSVNNGGYGMFSVNRFPVVAHRVALLFFRGVPLGGDRKAFQADHLCRVPACVNPDHLEMVTALENNLRRVVRQRSHCAQGHEFTEANTYIYRGGRQCRECHRIRQAVRNSLKPRSSRFKQTCKNGHAFTPENTKHRVKKPGQKFRECLTCRRINAANFKARKQTVSHA